MKDWQKRKWTIIAMALTFFHVCTTKSLVVLVLQDTTKLDSAIQTFPEPDPREDENAIETRAAVFRAEIPLDNHRSVKIWEHPTSATNYDSTVAILDRGKVVNNYSIGRLIGHQPLRLVHAALIRLEGGGMLVLEFEGGAVGAKEGFAIVHFSASEVSVRTLPLTEFGKVVIYKSDPQIAEIWSAMNGNIESAVDKRSYSVRRCHLSGPAYVCDQQKRPAASYFPGDINDPGIEIRE